MDPAWVGFIERWMYPFIALFLGLILIQVYARVEVRKKIIDTESDQRKARIYADGRAYQSKLDNLTDIRLASFQNPGGEQSELQEAMQMLGMLTKGSDAGSQLPVQNGIEAQLSEFAKTPEGMQSMKAFQTWQASNTNGE